jgi:hypothetical protein
MYLLAGITEHKKHLSTGYYVISLAQALSPNEALYTSRHNICRFVGLIASGGVAEPNNYFRLHFGISSEAQLSFSHQRSLASSPFLPNTHGIPLGGVGGNSIVSLGKVRLHRHI